MHVREVKRRWALALALAAACLPAGAGAATWHVAPPPAGNDANDGTGWVAPFASIQRGIDAAADGETVLVSNGTYVLTAALALTKHVTLRGLDRDTTIIDADGSNVNKRCISITASNAVLDGFTLRGGLIMQSYGGGVHLIAGTVQNCTIEGNRSSHLWGAAGTVGYGGGLFVGGGLVEDCTISGNWEDGHGGGAGGGIYMTNGIVRRCMIAANLGYLNGGGVFMTQGLLEWCVISNNVTYEFPGVSAPSYGGGVWLADGGVVRDCTIVGNRSQGHQQQGGGGGVWMAGGLLQRCQVIGNSAYYNGGGIAIAGGTSDTCRVEGNRVEWRPDVGGRGWGGGVYMSGGELANATLVGNRASGHNLGSKGGGVFIEGGAELALVRNCTIRDSYTTSPRLIGIPEEAYGGGVYQGTGTLRGCLIMGNTSDRWGGGVFQNAGSIESCTIVRNKCYGEGAEPASGGMGGGVFQAAGTIVNSIITGSEALQHPDIRPDATATFSCSPVLTAGTGNVTNDPQFVNGGAGAGQGSYVAGDYRLQTSSPCKDVGSGQAWMSAAVDLAGAARLNGVVDMGAYEYHDRVHSGLLIHIR